MKIPTIIGTIDRRILINYQVDKEVLTKYLPDPFRPKLVNDKGVVGICLIRLKNIRPKGLHRIIGISSENGAHRIAVEWTENGQTKEGVFIPRRDTSSKLNSLVGGRIFPGVHHHADFTVEEKNGTYAVKFTSDDETFLCIKAKETTEWNEDSIFDNLDCASDFFEKGAVGYSPDKLGETFEGLELKTYEWKVKPLTVSEVRSSFFEDETIFPKGTVKFDNALLMKSIEHEWKSTPPINTAIRLNPETGDGIIVLETGNPILATKLASEWVFWKTGKVDLTLFAMLKDNMVSTIGKGWLAIIIFSIIIGIMRYRKRKAIK